MKNWGSMNPTLVLSGSIVNVAVVAEEKQSSLAYLKEMVKYTEIISDCKRMTLKAVIGGHLDLYSAIHSDGLREISWSGKSWIQEAL